MADHPTSGHTPHIPTYARCAFMLDSIVRALYAPHLNLGRGRGTVGTHLFLPTAGCQACA